MTGQDLIGDIRPGDRVTIITPQGHLCKGKAVMPSGDRLGWVLNLGGPHGRPGLAYPDNVYEVRHTDNARQYSRRKRS